MFTWTCHVCGDMRLDDKISVFSREILIGSVKARENIRYCNDRAKCVAGARNVHFYKDGKRVDDAGKTP